MATGLLSAVPASRALALVVAHPIVGMASTPDGGGYWEVASDGGLFAFGDAGFFGSEGGRHLDHPIVGIAAPPDGGGYWEVASDGGIFTWVMPGSTAPRATNRCTLRSSGWGQPPTVTGIGRSPSDGGVFAFGDARFYGSEGGRTAER